MKSQLKILIVEDNRNDLVLLKAYLKISGLENTEVLSAETIDQAKDFILQQPDVIFLDLYLTDSQGLDTFNSINDLFPTTPILILTGLKDAEIALKAIQKGAQDYFVKGDFNEKIIYKAIKYGIERKKIEEKLRISIERYELIGKATSEAVWDLDLISNKINYWNDGMKTLFGYETTRLSNSIEWWKEKIHTEDVTAVVDKMRSLIKEKTERTSLEYRFECADGSFRQVLNKLLVIYHEGNPYRIIGSIQDIDELKKMQEELAREQISHQQRITEKTIEAQEQERMELGRELHDNINQILATSQICLDAAIRNEAMREEMLPMVLSSLRTAIEEIRKLAKKLVPPTLGHLGLDEAVHEMIHPFAVSHTVKFTRDIDSVEYVDPNLQLIFYRVIQEQLHNILKYANASEVFIAVKKSKDMIKLEITDNGIGFDVKKKSNGIGLQNIKSRAKVYGGSVKLISSPGSGCTLRMSVPTQHNLNKTLCQ
jgi:two-component system sensor histidine kinase UhpB